MDPSSVAGRRRLALAVGALGILSLLVLSALLVDPRVPVWGAHWKLPVLDAVVGVLNPIGAGATLLILCVAMTLVCRGIGHARLHDAAGLGALAFACAGLVEFTLKHLVGRPRPDAGLPTLAVLGPTFGHDLDSFPSGHATSVFAVATVFASFYPRLSVPFYLLAAAIAAGRVYLERHYPSDILAGAVIGMLIASALLRSRGGLPQFMALEPVDSAR